ncbi:MAG: hypothetical protein OEZ06_01865 [Myxococcales bacterium]|nr:hypothetical protein [Myxococcales bacterium]
MSEEDYGRKTSPGFADPALPVRAEPEPNERASRTGVRPASAVPVLQPASRLQAQSGHKAPLVEVELAYERVSRPQVDPLRRTYQIWTQNTVYELDPQLRCVYVRSPSGNKVDTDHPFLGARLVGGQLQVDGGIELSHPFPRPGSCAVFESRKNKRRIFSRTSEVERVVMRIKVVMLVDPAAEQPWAEIPGVE